MVQSNTYSNDDEIQEGIREESREDQDVLGQDQLQQFHSVESSRVNDNRAPESQASHGQQEKEIKVSRNNSLKISNNSKSKSTPDWK